MVDRFSTATDSGLSEGVNVLLSKRMVRSAPGASTLSITIPGTSTRNARFYTEAALPNNCDFQDGNCSATLKITTGFSNVDVKMELARVPSSGGTANEVGGALTAAQTGTTGDLTFNWSPATWTANPGVYSELLRWHIGFTTTNPTARTVQFEVGTSSTALTTPITDDVQATASLLGGSAASSATSSRANMLASLVAGATEVGGGAGRANLTAALAAGAAYLGNARATAVLAALIQAGATGRSASASRANLTASAAAGANDAATTASRANLTAALQAGAVSIGGLKGLAALAGQGRGGAVHAAAMNKVAQLIGRAVGASNFRAFIKANSNITGFGAAGAAGTGILKGTATFGGHNAAGAAGSAAVSFISGAVGCFQRIVQAVRDRYVAEIEVAESVDTLHDNEPAEDMNGADVWVRFTITAEPTRQLNLGVPSSHRYSGEAVARIFLRRGLGDGAAWDLADAINAAFRGVTADEIVYDPPPYPSVRGAVGDRWEVSVTVPFYGLCAEEAVA